MYYENKAARIYGGKARKQVAKPQAEQEHQQEAGQNQKSKTATKAKPKPSGKKTGSINPHIEEYMLLVEGKKIRACKEQHQLMKMVRKAFREEDIYTDEKLLDSYLGLQKYYHFKLFPWEVFLLGLHLCTFRADGMPRWPDLFTLVGRGAGKDGYIGFQSFCLISPYNPISRYNVDICANSELQAKTPFEDVHGVLESPEHYKKLRRFFYWNKEEIVGLKNKGVIKYRTNNPKGKDGLRSAQVVFNEVHQYENYDNINVFTTGLGKKPHPRRLYATTDGDVRDGPLDHYKERSKQVLEGAIPDNGWLPFICKLDRKSEVNDPGNWEKANPSLPYRPDLREEIAKEYIDWKADPAQFTAFITKRMNIPEGSPDREVASWPNILRCSREEVPDMKGCKAVFGFDYASLGDFASAGVLLRDGDMRYFKTHSWLCLKSKDIPRIKAPWQEWAKAGHLTPVDDVEIAPELLLRWLDEQAMTFHIQKGALDYYRYALLRGALEKRGFRAEDKAIKLVRPSDLLIVAPVIDSLFKNGNLIFGDNPLMRWAVNNTCISNTKEDKRLGNLRYGKIEGRSRKNDPFMAFAAAMTLDEELSAPVESDLSALTGPWIF
ncbi:MAG: terminase TerL endonuclease subunit [Christensenellales bacterium]